MYHREIMEAVITKAEECGGAEVPVVAAVAVGRDVVAFATNEVEATNVPWNHAEFIAVERALAVLGDRFLEKASIYATLEPCAFCAATLEKVRIKNIFFGAYDPKNGAIEHNARLFNTSLIKPNVVGGIQEARCARILRDFFARNLR
jgi:tRNA(adenine34) deaminase